MNPNVLDLLPGFALGTLAEDEMDRVARAINESPVLQAAVDAINEGLVANAATLAPVVPSRDVRARLLRSVGGADRFATFFDVMAQALDMTVDAVRALCSRIDRPNQWQAGPRRGIQLIHFQPGPRLAAAVDAGLVRMTPGTVFPRHRHLGFEWNMVLEGTLHDGERLYRPGDVFCYENQSAHEYSAGPERELIMIAMHHGIEDASAS
ncbi:MAG TPA: cupin domain-containing protein [Polyangia bacterium]|jgi:putative transcriptional regulator|nr:cupin domain-containing protein [Polyangia bacterium]